jgi:argininosuccinate lyase
MARIARTAATGGDLDPRFLAWSTSFPIDRRLLPQDCRGSAAHVEGLRAAGLLTADEADRLQRALAELPADVAAGRVELPSDEEDVHMAIEAWLGQAVGAPAAKLHTGRSRNDQVATDLKLWCRDAVADLEADLDQLLAVLDRTTARIGHVAMPSYTHRQVAIGVLARTWLEGALGEPLARDLRLLRTVADELADCPLGAGAIAGTTLPIDPEVAAAKLEFAHGPRNPIDAVGDRDHALTLVFTCARVALHLARFSADVVELASDGLLKLGGAIAGGSSMMPHKRNPDLFELVRGHAALRLGDLQALCGLVHGLGSGYHRDLQHDKQIVFAAVDGARGCIQMIAIALDHIDLDAEACRKALVDGDAIATDLCEALVLAGVPFREAYGRIGALVADQRAQGRRLADLGQADLQAAGLPTSLAHHLDPVASARRRSERFDTK